MKISRGLIAAIALLTSGAAVAQTRPPNGSLSVPTTPESRIDTGAVSGPNLYGRVMLDDGNPAPLDIQIRLTCYGNPHTVAYTDSKGRFNLATSGIMPDATNSGRTGVSSMTGCNLTAVAPGYQSDRVDLGLKQFNNGDLGTIVLHRLAGVEGRSISATSLAAPKDAAKAYEKGVQELEKNKPADAEKALAKAVEIYPKYAEAWFALGCARLAQKNADGACDAFVKAMGADDKLVGPYVELGQMAAEAQKWDDAAKYLDRALALDPIDYPQLWFTAAIADFNTRQLDAAERNAREAIKTDPEGKTPRSRELLGLVLDQKNDTAGALAAFREFLRLAPAGPDAEKTRQRVAELVATAKTN